MSLEKVGRIPLRERAARAFGAAMLTGAIIAPAAFLPPPAEPLNERGIYPGVVITGGRSDAEVEVCSTITVPNFFGQPEHRTFGSFAQLQEAMYSGQVTGEGAYAGGGCTFGGSDTRLLVDPSIAQLNPGDMVCVNAKKWWTVYAASSPWCQ